MTMRNWIKTSSFSCELESVGSTSSLRLGFFFFLPKAFRSLEVTNCFAPLEVLRGYSFEMIHSFCIAERE
jgi:hypothetical protein